MTASFSGEISIAQVLPARWGAQLGAALQDIHAESPAAWAAWYGSGHHSKLPARAGARPRLASPTARAPPRPHFVRGPQNATRFL